MKFRTLLILLLAGAWGLGSWWWYTCQIKGFCETRQTGLTLTDEISSAAASLGLYTMPTDNANQNNDNDSGSTQADSDNKTSTSELNNTSAKTNTDQETTAAAETVAASPAENTDATASEQDTAGASTAAADDNQTENTTAISEQDTTGTASSVAVTEEAENPEQAPDQNQTPIQDTVSNPSTADETTENNSSTEAAADSDGDGLPDVIETRLGLDINAVDSDKDGVNDFLETGDDFDNPLDSDGDGIINALDIDDDGDDDPTANEAPDPDQDGDPDDARDTDGDLIPDYLDQDTKNMSNDDDGDGLNNSEEKLLGTNPTLTDSDGDGLADTFEAQDNKDSDGDGTIDALDPDDDDDGLMTAMESADPNGDTDPADALDSNNNGKPDYLDTDNVPTALPDSTSTTDDTDNTKQPVAEQGEQDASINQASDTDTATTEAGNAETATTETADTKEPASEQQAEEATVEDNEDNSDKVTLETSAAQQGGDATQNIRFARLYFPFRSANPELADDVTEYFDLVIKQLGDNPDVKIKVTGHTDSVGRGAANRRLGRKRAEEVRDMLVKRGAPEAQVMVDSKGEGEPIADNKTEAGRKKNRRVEIEPVR